MRREEPKKNNKAGVMWIDVWNGERKRERRRRQIWIAWWNPKRIGNHSIHFTIHVPSTHERVKSDVDCDSFRRNSTQKRASKQSIPSLLDFICLVCLTPVSRRVRWWMKGERERREKWKRRETTTYSMYGLVVGLFGSNPPKSNSFHSLFQKNEIVYLNWNSTSEQSK